MENSSGSTADYSSEFEPMKKMKREYSSGNDCKVIEIEESEDVWIKPKSEKKDGMENAKNSFCGRLNVITAVHSPSRNHLSDGAASSSEMSPGGSSPSRSCTQCGATKTPLWRNGPCGPKSLCNACGIRYKKVGSSTKRNSNNSNNNNASDSHDHQSKPSTLKSPKRKADTADVIERDRERERAHSNIIHNRRSKREIVEHKVSQMVFRQSTARVSVPRRVCTRRSIPAFHSTPKWGSRSARFNNTFRKSQNKDEEEEGAALLMALACGLVNA